MPVESETRSGRVVFTMVKNEQVFLSIWLRYYSQFFSPENIYVLDHGSDDDSLAKARENFEFRSIRLDYPIYNDFQWYTGTVMQFQKELLKRYELVLFTEPDEVIYHQHGLGQYMDDFALDCVHTLGYELHHAPDEEPSLDFTKPILSQRKYWYRQDGFSKPLLGRVPIEWNAAGFHTASNCSIQDPELLLIHLHKMDYTLAYQKNQRVAKYKWSNEAVQNGWGWHNKALDERFIEWYYKDSLCGGTIETIPEVLRKHPPV